MTTKIRINDINLRKILAQDVYKIKPALIKEKKKIKKIRKLYIITSLFIIIILFKEEKIGTIEK